MRDRPREVSVSGSLESLKSLVEAFEGIAPSDGNDEVISELNSFLVSKIIVSFHESPNIRGSKSHKAKKLIDQNIRITNRIARGSQKKVLPALASGANAGWVAANVEDVAAHFNSRIVARVLGLTQRSFGNYGIEFQRNSFDFRLDAF